MLLAGVVGGALWAGIAGVLRYWRNVPEVLSTLLLTAVAANLMGYGLRKRVAAPRAGGRPRQPQPGQRAAGRRHPHPARHRVRQRVPDQRAPGHRTGARDVGRPRPLGGRLPPADARTQPAHRAARRRRRASLRHRRDADLRRVRRSRRRGDAGRWRLRQLPARRQLRRRASGSPACSSPSSPGAGVRADLRRLRVRRAAHRVRVPPGDRRLRPHRRRRAGPARAGPRSSRRPFSTSASAAGAGRRRERPAWATSSRRSATSPPTRARTATR